MLPPCLKLLLSPSRGSRHFYETLNQQNENLTLRTKWNGIFNIDIDKDDWENVYKVSFKTLALQKIIFKASMSSNSVLLLLYFCLVNFLGYSLLHLGDFVITCGSLSAGFLHSAVIKGCK